MALHKSVIFNSLSDSYVCIITNMTQMLQTKIHLISNLTSREFEVLATIAKGYLHKEIAIMLDISIDTVKKHSANIYNKLQVRNKTEAILVLNLHENSMKKDK
jgi:DNA-binding NarL/FixJ family response regulator